jgi:hypothetical protein
MVVPYHLLSNDVIDWMKQYMPPTFYVHIVVNDVIDWMEWYIPSILCVHIGVNDAIDWMKQYILPILYVHIGVNDAIDWMTQYILPTLYVHIVVIVDSTKVPVLIFFLIFFFSLFGLGLIHFFLQKDGWCPDTLWIHVMHVLNINIHYRLKTCTIKCKVCLDTTRHILDEEARKKKQTILLYGWQ